MKNKTNDHEVMNMFFKYVASEACMYSCSGKNNNFYGFFHQTI